jgi:hypothetical protein
MVLIRTLLIPYPKTSPLFSIYFMFLQQQCCGAIELQGAYFTFIEFVMEPYRTKAPADLSPKRNLFQKPSTNIKHGIKVIKSKQNERTKIIQITSLISTQICIRPACGFNYFIKYYIILHNFLL